MTFERDRKIDREIETSMELAHSDKPIVPVAKRGFGVPQSPIGTVPVCQYVTPNYPLLLVRKGNTRRR